MPFTIHLQYEIDPFCIPSVFLNLSTDWIQLEKNTLPTVHALNNVDIVHDETILCNLTLPNLLAHWQIPRLIITLILKILNLEGVAAT